MGFILSEAQRLMPTLNDHDHDHIHIIQQHYLDDAVATANESSKLWEEVSTFESWHKACVQTP
jgi:hypothetical protein